MNKSTEKEKEILNDINKILEKLLSPTEQKILITAKKQLEKGDYFPKIIKDLESSLTPLVVQRNLSKELGDLYLKITSHRFKNKGFGHGFFSIFGINH